MIQIIITLRLALKLQSNLRRLFLIQEIHKKHVPNCFILRRQEDQDQVV